MKQYVDVILPLPLANRSPYSLPDALQGQVAAGSRVIVPFGRKKYYTALVANVHYCPPEAYETKDVAEVLDANPILLPGQFRLWEWIAFTNAAVIAIAAANIGKFNQSAKIYSRPNVLDCNSFCSRLNFI